MLIFGNDKHARGCFREMQDKATLGNGAYLTLPGLERTRTTPYFVSNVSFTQREKFQVVQCFNDKNYVYAFGHDPMSSLVDVVFTLFLTDYNGTSFGAGLKTLLGAYGKARLSKKQEYATLTLGTVTLQGFVISMRSATEDGEHNLQSFSVTLLLVEAQNG